MSLLMYDYVDDAILVQLLLDDFGSLDVVLFLYQGMMMMAILILVVDVNLQTADANPLDDGLLLMTHLVLMTFLSSSSDDLLDEETILLHMILLVDGSIPYPDAILLDELDYDAKIDALLLANHNDAILDVVHDPNNDDDTPDATLLLNILPDDPTLLMGCCQDTLDEVVQRCCIQSDVEVHDDDHSMSPLSSLGSHS